MSSLVILILLCLSLHACDASRLRLADKENRKQADYFSKVGVNFNYLIYFLFISYEQCYDNNLRSVFLFIYLNYIFYIQFFKTSNNSFNFSSNYVYNNFDPKPS